MAENEEATRTEEGDHSKDDPKKAARREQIPTAKFAMSTPSGLASDLKLRPWKEGVEKTEVLEGEDLTFLLIWRCERLEIPEDADEETRALIAEEYWRPPPRVFLTMRHGATQLVKGETSVEKVGPDRFETGEEHFKVVSRLEPWVEPGTPFPLDLDLNFEIIVQERSWRDIVDHILSLELDLDDAVSTMDDAFMSTQARPFCYDPPQIRLPCRVHRPWELVVADDADGRLLLRFTNRHPTSTLSVVDVDAFVDPDEEERFDAHTLKWRDFTPPPKHLKPNDTYELDIRITAAMRPPKDGQALDNKLKVFLELMYHWHDLDTGEPMQNVFYRPPFFCHLPQPVNDDDSENITVVNLDNPGEPIPDEYREPTPFKPPEPDEEATLPPTPPRRVTRSRAKKATAAGGGGGAGGASSKKK